MSILIKGMEMPKNCESCRFCYAFPLGETDIYVKCTALNRLIPQDNKPKRNDCPLVELPPHGRLIDADALTTVTEMVDGKWKTYIEEFEIDAAPTIIEAEGADE